MAQKKQKAGSPLSKKDLLRLEKALLEEKQRVLRQSSFTQQVMDTPAAAGDLSSHRTHVADQGTENYQRELASQLKSIESDALREIDAALDRIARGTYGICERCGEPIPLARLEVIPYARLCMKCLKSRQT
ncbi:MAG: TraR/DksA C4-type zinc finger protein [candidate division WOR-3 bacterium]|uniref:TraR/DksA family transcriptional regulator n=1 Tax=candidate division WOR-3 bacterium TaxID=2052148 RepID=A0A7C1NB55_UNCW3|nr:TraR/DksA C4-type zinc finger protein [candidate division WOR-3 bacterium]